MAQKTIPAPGHALNDYLSSVELLLDGMAHGKISWSEMLDLQLAATSRLHGRLLDHFLARAHTRQEVAAGRAGAGIRDGA